MANDKKKGWKSKLRSLALAPAKIATGYYGIKAAEGAVKMIRKKVKKAQTPKGRKTKFYGAAELGRYYEKYGHYPPGYGG